MFTQGIGHPWTLSMATGKALLWVTPWHVFGYLRKGPPNGRSAGMVVQRFEVFLVLLVQSLGITLVALSGSLDDLSIEAMGWPRWIVVSFVRTERVRSSLLVVLEMFRSFMVRRIGGRVDADRLDMRFRTRLGVDVLLRVLLITWVLSFVLVGCLIGKDPQHGYVVGERFSTWMSVFFTEVSNGFRL